MTCVKCGTTTATHYYGKRKGKPVCTNCYQRERQVIYREKNKRKRIKSMWGEE